MKNIEEFLNYNAQESKIFMPNEIFKDFQDERIKKTHRPFAFSYYYLINYLYRNAKYGDMQINVSQLKEILGYSPINKRINYLIKDKGILDQMQYTETTRDIPMGARREATYGFTDQYKELTFMHYDEYLEFMEGVSDEHKMIFTNNFKIHKPVRAFHKWYVDKDEPELNGIDETVLDGTFYEVENTTLIHFEIFLFCMERKDIECDGFYLYSYLKMMNDRFSDGYDVSLTQLCNDLGFSRGNLVNTLDALKRHRMIQVYHNQEYFAVGLKEEDRKSNTYITNDWDFFNDNGDTEYQKIKYIDRKKYEEILEKEKNEQEEKVKKKVKVALEELPY